ncbi:MAG: hypothetical protein M0Z67_09455 [Nitrospiraceae bacterium]|nr:hypothetical protein [Nitrospiraceae bacterium]
MRTGSENRGFIKGFFLLALFVGVSFLLISFGKPYYRYNTLRSHTKDILMMELGNIGTIKENVMAEAVELHVPLEEENLSVTQQGPNGKVIKVKATWSETVNFWDYYQKRLDFDMEEEY